MPNLGQKRGTGQLMRFPVSLEALRALRNLTKAIIPFVERFWCPSRKPDVCQWGPACCSQLGSC